MEIVLDLVELGADISAQDWAFLTACRHGHLDIVQYFVSLGINVDIQENCGLGLSLQNNHLDVIKYLISNGAYIDTDYALLVSINNNHIDIVKYIIENLSWNENNIIIALENCCKIGRLDILRYLKNKIEFFDADYYLKISLLYKNYDIAKYLVDEGADGGYDM